jgi:hypothetical protein
VIAHMHTPDSDGTTQLVQSQGGLTTQPTDFYANSNIDLVSVSNVIIDLVSVFV